MPRHRVTPMVSNHEGMTAVHYAIWISLSLAVAAQRDSLDQILTAGCSVCEVRFDLTLNKGKYEVGEPIILAIRLTNIGSAPVEIPLTSDVTGRHDGYAFAVTDASGRRIPNPGEGSIAGLGALGGVKLTMLKDPVADVRHVAASAVGGYEDAAALEALKGVVHDPDPSVSEQATIAVGWVAESSEPNGATRKDAIEVLRSVKESGGAAGRQALYWLARVGSR